MKVDQNKATIRPQHAWALALCAAFSLACATASVAGDRSKVKTSGAQSTYQSDRAACLGGQTHQDRATCLREAGAARVEATRGGLSDGDVAENRFIRCNPLPAGDREDCVRRMNGEGTIIGSVEEGGIYRELRTVVPVTE